jgi:hypothetical protein
MANPRPPHVSEETLERYEKVVATLPDVPRRGDSIPYTSLNGHMFSYIGKSGTVALRLPSPEREAFLEKYKTRLYQAYGIVQKEYVEVPHSLLKKTAELKRFFASSLAYVRSLKPKPTTRKKKA